MNPFLAPTLVRELERDTRDRLGCAGQVHLARTAEGTDPGRLARVTATALRGLAARIDGGRPAADSLAARC